MICTKCNEPINHRGPYFRTKKGAHHFKCGVANLPDKLPNSVIEQMVETYDHRGPSETKFEAMTRCANLARKP